MQVRRFDLLGPQAQTKTRFDETTRFFHATVRPTRTGVFVYRKADGTISRELRHPDDVFAPESIESLKRIVVTRGHPRDSNGHPIDVTTENVATLQVGHGGDDIRRVTRDGFDHPEIDVTVTREDVAQSIHGKRRAQVSMGYTVEIIDESGSYNGERYDRRHKNILYNHLAVDIDAGRGGQTVSFHLDEADAVLIDDEQLEKKAMAKMKIDGVECELDTGVANLAQTALEKRDAQIDELKKQLKAKADAIEGQQAKLDQATKELAEAKTKTDAVDVGKTTKEVLSVVAKADAVLGLDKDARIKLLELKGDDLPAAIRKHVVLTACADEADALASKSDAYFEARFDALVAVAAKTDSTAPLARTVLEAAGKTRSNGDEFETRMAEIFKRDEDPLAYLDPKHCQRVPA